MSSVLTIAAVCAALTLGPGLAFAQTSSDSHRETNRERAHEAAERHKRESAERQQRAREAAEHRKHEAARKHEQVQSQQRQAAERREREAEERRQRTAVQRDRSQTKDTGQQAIERERARERQAAERREREQWERSRIEANQQRMWEADRERNPSRAGVQSPAPSPYLVPGTRPAPAPRTTTRSSTSSGTTCTANPVCPASNGYGNVCMGVSHTYPGAGTAQTGLRDIVSRCQSANAPDLCSGNYRVTFGGGCAQQCASVARCTAAAAR